MAVLSNIQLVVVFYLVGLYLNLDVYNVTNLYFKNEVLKDLFGIKELLFLTILINVLSYAVDKSVFMLPFNLLWGNLGYKLLVCGGEIIKTPLAIFTRERSIEEKLDKISEWESRDNFLLPLKVKDELSCNSINYDDLYKNYVQAKHELISASEGGFINVVSNIFNSVCDFAYNHYIFTGLVVLCGVGIVLYTGVMSEQVLALKKHQSSLDLGNKIDNNLLNLNKGTTERLNNLSETVRSLYGGHNKCVRALKVNGENVMKLDNNLNQLDVKVDILGSTVSNLSEKVNILKELSAEMGVQLNELTDLFIEQSSTCKQAYSVVKVGLAAANTTKKFFGKAYVLGDNSKSNEANNNNENDSNNNTDLD